MPKPNPIRVASQSQNRPVVPGDWRFVGVDPSSQGRTVLHFQSRTAGDIYFVYEGGDKIAVVETEPDVGRVASMFQSRTAGEVRFIKDRGSDKNEWAFADAPPSERDLKNKDYEWNSKSLKPLAKVLRSTAAALGHTMSGYQVFAKIKSREVSPDGNLGGKGYIQAIKDMRRQYMNVVEALSALSDTLYDEIKGPHWSQMTRGVDPETADIVEDAEAIKENPAGWAKGEEKEMDAEHDGKNNSKALKDADPNGPDAETLNKMASAPSVGDSVVFQNAVSYGRALKMQRGDRGVVTKVLGNGDLIIEVPEDVMPDLPIRVRKVLLDKGIVTVTPRRSATTRVANMFLRRLP